jgi:hypothetical protein
MQIQQYIAALAEPPIDVLQEAGPHVPRVGNGAERLRGQDEWLLTTAIEVDECGGDLLCFPSHALPLSISAMRWRSGLRRSRGRSSQDTDVSAWDVPHQDT